MSALKMSAPSWAGRWWTWPDACSLVMCPPCAGNRASGKRRCRSGKIVAVDDDLDSVLTAVGPRLRTLRHRLGTTLADLSASTGISVSTLSRLESGQRRPTLELLLPLSRAYGVQIDELVGAPPTGDPRIHLRPVTRDGMTVVPLTRRAGGPQAYKLVISRTSNAAGPDLRTHEGYEWLYVLSGRLRLVLGDQDLVLDPGEAAEFDTRVPHWFGSADTRLVEILSLFGRQGERAHLRARSTPRSTGVNPG
jgi:transcriptional regulator with XRE-family HTH domain